MILDGWGLAKDTSVSAIDKANTPFVDGLYDTYSHSRLEASGLAVGLPAGQMGNSEVGHMNIGAGRVVLRTAPSGTGIIAGGAMRALFESLGVKDVVAKSTGTSNPHNMLKATFDAFKKSESPKSVAAKRSKKVNEIITNKN